MITAGRASAPAITTLSTEIAPAASAAVALPTTQKASTAEHLITLPSSTNGRKAAGVRTVETLGGAGRVPTTITRMKQAGHQCRVNRGLRSQTHRTWSVV